MSDNAKGCLVIAVLAGLIALSVGTAAYKIDVITRRAETAKWQREAVARGVAGYDEQTGEWEWTVERKVAE